MQKITIDDLYQAFARLGSFEIDCPVVCFNKQRHRPGSQKLVPFYKDDVVMPKLAKHLNMIMRMKQLSTKEENKNGKRQR